MKSLLRGVVASLALSLCAAWAPQAVAQGYPSKPIKILVPFGAGSGSDLIARIVADKLAEQMKVAVVVENREGAGGVIGTQIAARSAPDGYTLVMVSNVVAIAPLLYTTAPYDALKDFTPVAKVTISPLALLTAPNSPYKTVPEMITYLKANPNTSSYASSGKGAQSHLEAAQLLRIFNVNVPDVPYKTTTQAITDTSTGQVSFYIAGLAPALAQVQGGKLRALAVGGGKRAAALPDVPTIAEAISMPGYDLVSWVGMLAPAGTPPEIVNRLYEEIAKASETPQMRERLARLNNEVGLVAPQQFAVQLRAESDKWGALVKALNIKNE